MADETTTETTAAETTETTTEATEPAAKAETTPARQTRSARMASIFERVHGEKPEPAKAAEAKKDGEPAKAPEKEQTPQEKADAKAFAALAREKGEARKLREEAASLDHRARETMQAAEVRVTQAEQRAKEAETRADRVLSDPDAFFDAFVKLTGIRDMKGMAEFAANRWQRPAEVPPEQRPLTQADLQKHLDTQREQQKSAADREKAEGMFDALFDIPDDEKAEVKYPHAALGWDRARRVAEGNKLATALTKLGRSWTLESIADAVNEMAKADPDVQKKLKKLGQTASVPAGGEKKPATQTAQPAAKTVAAPTTPPASPKQNGAGRMSHKDRIANLKESLKAV